MDIKAVLKRADEIAEEFLEGLGKQLEPMVYGTSVPTDEDIRIFWGMQEKRYPPALYVRTDPETGLTEARFDSPWMIALREKNCRGGEAVARRIERALNDGAS